MKFYWFKALCWLDETIIRHRSYWFCQYSTLGLLRICEHRWLYHSTEVLEDKSCRSIWYCRRCDSTEFRYHD